MNEAVKVEGFVDKVWTNHGTSKAGKPYTSYSIQLQLKNGSQDPVRYSAGFKHPGVEENQYVRFQATPYNEKSANLVDDTIEIHPNPPDRPEKTYPRKGGGKSYGAEKNVGAFGVTRGNYSEDDLKRITWGTAVTHALQLTAIAQAHGAKIPKTDIKGYVNKLTVEMYHDAVSLRLLDHVDDAGQVEEVPPQELPDGSVEETDSEEW